ncbi:MAG TPA: pyridoxal-phosphate dependent enzyme, partial [Sporolactobacillaceae bacterium]|nr:pyridoxal-phosphate dependent enzyme [Sporolactobacillaceae bacterium]
MKWTREGQEVQEPLPLEWLDASKGLYHLESIDVAFPIETIRKRPPSLWRYKEALPMALFGDSWQRVSMGEGMTPIVTLDSDNGLYGKMDYLMPTLSFKDRGAVMLIAYALKKGYSRVMVDSSGNAGTALAAYAARAGIVCDIFVPETTSDKKVKQIEAHQATVHKIPGPREASAIAAQDAVRRTGAFYASHVYNPIFYQGTKTFVFEIWEAWGGRLPDYLVLPVGNGTLILGAYLGLLDLKKAGLIAALPHIVAVQAANCNPIAQAFDRGERTVKKIAGEETRAEGIAIADPPRGADIL